MRRLYNDDKPYQRQHCAVVVSVIATKRHRSSTDAPLPAMIVCLYMLRFSARTAAQLQRSAVQGCADYILALFEYW